MNEKTAPAATIEETIGLWLRRAAEAINGIDTAAVARAVALLSAVRARDGVIYTAGNGGSASTASHLALDLQKPSRSSRSRGTRAIALSDSIGLITAWSNDASYDRVFAEQLDLLGRPGDGVVVISVSGASANLIALIETAREREITSIGLLGHDGGPLGALVDAAVLVPSGDMGWVEGAHIVLHHVLSYALRGQA